MALNINSLPHDCLYINFCLLPVRDLLRAGRVCSKWHKLRQAVGLRVHKLTVVICGEVTNNDYPNFTVGYSNDRLLNEDGTVMFPRREYPSWHSVHFKRLDLNALASLAVIFPNVRSLEIAFNMSLVYELCAVTMLLRLWQTKLVSFKLRTVFDDGISSIPGHISGPLFEAINSLSALEHLSLLFSNTRFDQVQLNLSILAQLGQFNFSSLNQTNLLENSLRDYALTNAALRLCIKLNMAWDVDHLDEYYRLGHGQLCSQFEQIPDEELQLFELTDLVDLCSHFTSLTTLWFVFEDLLAISIRDLFANLSRLTQLVNFDLNIVFGVGEGEEDDDEGDEDVEDVEDHDDQAPFARLPSLKSFSLYTRYLVNHDHLAQFNIPWTMPNLQIVHVHMYVPDVVFHCDICGHVQVKDDFQFTDQLLLCLSHAMMPLGQCTRLHAISFAISDVSAQGTAHSTISIDDITIQQLSRPLNLRPNE